MNPTLVAAHSNGHRALADVSLASRPGVRRPVDRVAAERAAADLLDTLGADVQADGVPYFFSDQYDVGMEYAGYATSWDEVVFRGDPESREFIAFWLQDMRVVAGMNVNVWDVNEHIQGLIRARRQIDRRRLVDPDVALEDLLAPSGRTS